MGGHARRLREVESLGERDARAVRADHGDRTGREVDRVERVVARVRAVASQLLRRRPNVGKRFDREAATLAQLQHPHVVEIFDHGTTSRGNPYIVMELLEGQDLRRRIKKRGPMSLEDVATVLRQVGDALRAAQDDLVQAGKMSALGHMAAGIAHELNQPLSAIRGFADNARVLLSRERQEEADENLGRISDLTARAARIRMPRVEST